MPHSYWRTKAGSAIDFVVYGLGDFWAIEVKHSARVRAADLRSLKMFREDYPEVRCAFVYRGRERLQMDGIRVCPARNFCRGCCLGILSFSAVQPISFHPRKVSLTLIGFLYAGLFCWRSGLINAQ